MQPAFNVGAASAEKFHLAFNGIDAAYAVLSSKWVNSTAKSQLSVDLTHRLIYPSD